MLYLDYNATSPLHPEVCRRMAPYLKEMFGNPSSLHAVGRQARDAVESVRSRILAALGDPAGDLIFTSGGTEADNLAVAGVCRTSREKGDHLIVSAVEHHAVLHPAEALGREGWRVTVVPVDDEGRVDPAEVERAIEPRTALISIMQANNEVGTIQPIQEIGRIARRRGVLFHTDAVQSFGKLPLDARQVGADLLSISAHKLGGPKGVGALYLRKGIRVSPLLHGGPHERSRRAGTEGVAGIVGMGAAVEVSLKQIQDGTVRRIQRLRDRLQQGLWDSIPEIAINGRTDERLPGTLNVSFLGTHGETLLMAFDLEGICVSTGSACSSGSTEPSHVLAAMGLAPERIESSIRFSLGWKTTKAEIDEALEKIPPIVERVRKSTPSAVRHE